MIAQAKLTTHRYRCCPVCGCDRWYKRRVPSGSVVLDCAECEMIVRDREGLCPSPEQIREMAAELRAMRPDPAKGGAR